MGSELDQYEDLLNGAYEVTMPDNSVWVVPVAVIAENRAEYYQDDFGSLEASLVQDTCPLFNLDDKEIESWAKGNMNWDEIEEYAVMIDAATNVDYQDGWINGDVSIS